MEIYTIGHSNYPYDKLLEMIKKYNIDCVVDIRETPYSKYNVQYNKEDFHKSLKKSGYKYIYMGKEFGAKRIDPASYTLEGYADFEEVLKEDVFLNGIKRLRNGCEMGYRIVLLGAMQDPIRCHRSVLMGRILREEGFIVNHILHEEILGDEEYIENSLLDKYFSNRNQLSMDNLLGTAMSREDMINEAYKMANKEIGYRTEHLEK
ncbi:DUF488 family protein [Metaclostridioides mangenotii]|uniref:DUF488 domain-containing protein n=1 Tax=Metaclostridioides mangenotii TaxID=1540 RepID=UPI000487A952|nr:DUF488 domain-containing protein [Clostridioides mangenotii]